MSDINKLKDIYEQYRKIKGYNKGGEVQHYYSGGEVIDPGLAAFMQQNPTLDPTIAAIAYRNKQHMPPSPTPAAPAPQNSNPYQNFAEKAVGGFADGGEVPDTSNLTPEQFQAHLDQLQSQGMHLNNVSGEDQNVIGGNPVSEASVEDQEDPDDKELENSMANEDFAATEDNKDESEGEGPQIDEETASSQKTPEQPVPSEPLAQEAKNLEGMTLNKNEALAENPEQSSVERLLAAVKPQAGTSLADAQKQRDRNIMANQIGQAGVMIGAGLSRTDPSQQLAQLKDNEKFINMPVQKYDELIADQQNDPNSAVSQTMRQYLQSKGFKVPDNTSGAALLKVAPFLAKDQALQTALQKTIMGIQARASEGEKNRTSRENIAKDNQALRDAQLKAYKERTDAQLKGPNDRKMQSRFDLYAKALREGGDQSVKLGRQNIIRAKNLFLTNGVDPNISEQEINKIPDAQLNKINRIQVVENGIELNRLLSGSNQGAQTTLDKLIPKNIQMDSTKVQDYMNNNLNPAQQAQALKAYMKVAARARDLNKSVVNNYIKQTLPAAKQAFDYFPEQSGSLQEEFKQQGFDLSPTQAKTAAPAAFAEVERLDPKSGKIAVYDNATKKFLRWK